MEAMRHALFFVHVLYVSRRRRETHYYWLAQYSSFYVYWRHTLTSHTAACTQPSLTVSSTQVSVKSTRADPLRPDELAEYMRASSTPPTCFTCGLH